MADVLVHGPRLDLVPVRPEHHARLRELHLAPAVRAWWRSPADAWPANPEAYEHFYAVVLSRPLDEHPAGAVGGFIQWGEETEPDYRHAGIDLFLDPALHGRGLGTEMLQVLCAHLVDAHGFHRLTIDPEADNAVAVATYRKVGFRDVGILRRAARNEAGEWRDALLLDLLAEELVRVGDH